MIHCVNRWRSVPLCEMLVFSFLSLSIWTNSSHGASLTKKEAFFKAESLARSQQYVPEATYPTIVEENNSMWHKYRSLIGRHATPSFEAKYQKADTDLREKNFWALHYVLKQIPNDGYQTGDLWVFVDANDGSIITSLEGDLGDLMMSRKREHQLLKPSPTVERNIGNDQATMVLISPGEFLMGTYQEEADELVVRYGLTNGRFADETPQHRMYLDAFYLDKFEVTVSQYSKFIIDTKREKPAFWGQADLLRDPNKPVIGVNWYDAFAYCAWVGKRLPTEAEWEKAARGIDARTYPWGHEHPTSHHANFGRKPSSDDGSVYHKFLVPVGAYDIGKSFYGVYDLAGNVLEWVSDWYDKDYYRASPQKNPTGPDQGKLKVIRGGGWHALQQFQRSSYRASEEPMARSQMIGFRCAATVGAVP